MNAFSQILLRQIIPHVQTEGGELEGGDPF